MTDGSVLRHAQKGTNASFPRRDRDYANGKRMTPGELLDKSDCASRQRGDKPVLTGISILGFGPDSSALAAGMEKGDLIIEYNGIGNLTTEKLTALTAATKPAGTETRVVFLRDGKEHSVALPQGPLGISAMDATIQGSAGSKIARDKIESIIRIIQKVYFVIALLPILFAPVALAKSSGIGHVVQDVLFAILYGCAYFGLRRRREWAIPLVLIVSAFGCFSGLIGLVQPAADIKALLGKIFFLLWFFFSAYQIAFFRRADVRALFGDKGTLIF